METEKWQFPFLPWPPAGLGCWERHSSLFSRCGLAKIQKRLCQSAEGGTAAIMAGTFGHPGELSGEDIGRVEEWPLLFNPIFLAFLLPSPCPVPSPALSLLRRWRQRLALFMQKLWEKRKNWITPNLLHTPQTSGIFPAHPPTVSLNQQQCCVWHWQHRDPKDLSACLGQSYILRESFKKFKKFNSLPSCFP